MAQYKTPDVYVRERSLLSPSVAEVPTAIPAFIGYTELTTDNEDNTITQKPYRITNMMEYMAMFGGPYNEAVRVEYKPEAGVFVIPRGDGINPTLSAFFLYQAVAHFFANGGGACYVVSIGGYETAPSVATVKAQSHFTTAITTLKKVDEVTLISCPESICLEAQGHYEVHNASLLHCESMQDRFALIDLQQVGNEGDDNIRADAALMRDKVTQGLKYGAAYYPQLRTSVARSYDEDDVMVNMDHNYYKLHSSITEFIAFDDDLAVAAGKTAVEDAIDDAAAESPARTLSEVEKKAAYDTGYNTAVTQVPVDEFGMVSDEFKGPHFIKLSVVEIIDGKTTDPAPIKVVNFLGREVITANGPTQGQMVDSTLSFGLYCDYEGTNYLNASGQVVINTVTDGQLAASTSTSERIAATQNLTVPLSVLNIAGYTLASTVAYNQIKSLLSKHYLQLPPSAAIAGVMAKTDAQHGVWKAPANIALAQVIAPSITIDNSEQEYLNVDDNAGKSINAIRSFVGKGTLVWGARTLDGNSNEWRYVPVRRLFNMVEESIKKASYFAVFEPNTPFTWLKLKTTIEGYLESLFRQGAFFGTSTDEAFFVNVGLGQTMTEDDINNGIMNIEIGLAAVRPAEFIVLTFSHKSISA
ncbi:phage tail sheath family protein [Shewanella surugensis]|uniref:Phage tail sheath subtilisin-like domain-containing protein n=1 Tax=Shewanella surugensis TaxID=212020 RepID=A0ABT0L692_9GAMM|nr:phage tail sheath C-terminal domain-containing protein [Shewanella surugensis]MCL1123198.1 phage tail sheath subtilisin-like domain-containing protein [Shewanella surugensis]